MSFRLKNVGATYQQLVDTVFSYQIKRNFEVYIDNISHGKTDLPPRPTLP